MEFYKFDGAGNDFVVVDNRDGRFALGEKEIARVCHRRFGVGADGLMTLDSCQQPTPYDFVMHYYNSDGRLGSMCGNGGRCIAAFAHMLGLGRELHFMAFDGPHSAVVDRWDGRQGQVTLGMRDVRCDTVRRVEGGWALDTGSPHFVLPVEDLEHYDVVGEGRRWRHRSDLFPDGVNVDFVEYQADSVLNIRTYERGVEDETWACGTGVTASALVTGCHSIVARGGNFNVDFENDGQIYSNIRLCGPVSLNFKGQWTSSVQ
jgi:diaminopimelate epimerase